MLKPTVYVPEKIAVCGMELLRGMCDVIAPWEGGVPADPERVARADAVVVRLFKVDEAFLAGCPGLRVIAKHGVGVDNIDVKAASGRRVPVVFTPMAIGNAVAEHAVALMMALARQIAPASVAVREGRFAERVRFEGVELAGKTMGVAGLGRIGARVAEMAKGGLGMRVLGFDPVIKREMYQGPAELVDTFDALVDACDFISFHVPLTDATRQMVNSRTLARMKPGCRIINTSRGGIIDEGALVAALHEGRIGGAALDVFENEPLPAGHALCGAPNVLLTPHISSSTKESLDRMARDAAQGVLDVLSGRRPQYLVNPEVVG